MAMELNTITDIGRHTECAFWCLVCLDTGTVFLGAHAGAGCRFRFDKAVVEPTFVCWSGQIPGSAGCVRTWLVAHMPCGSILPALQ